MLFGLFSARCRVTLLPAEGGKEDYSQVVVWSACSCSVIRFVVSLGCVYRIPDVPPSLQKAALPFLNLFPNDVSQSLWNALMMVLWDAPSPSTCRQRLRDLKRSHPRNMEPQSLDKVK